LNKKQRRRLLAKQKRRELVKRVDEEEDSDEDDQPMKSITKAKDKVRTYVYVLTNVCILRVLASFTWYRLKQAAAMQRLPRP